MHYVGLKSSSTTGQSGLLWKVRVSPHIHPETSHVHHRDVPVSTFSPPSNRSGLPCDGPHGSTPPTPPCFARPPPFANSTLAVFLVYLLYTSSKLFSNSCTIIFFRFFGATSAHLPAAACGPLSEKNARGGRRSQNRADIAQHGAARCCAHCVRAVHRVCTATLPTSLTARCE